MMAEKKKMIAPIYAQGFEYKVDFKGNTRIDRPGETGGQRLEDFLNARAKEGWRYKGVAYYESDDYLVFERKVRN